MDVVDVSFVRPDHQDIYESLGIFYSPDGKRKVNSVPL